jgi:hypothetical protein
MDTAHKRSLTVHRYCGLPYDGGRHIIMHIIQYRTPKGFRLDGKKEEKSACKHKKWLFCYTYTVMEKVILLSL